MGKSPISVTVAWGLICPGFPSFNFLGFGFNVPAEFPNTIGAGGDSLPENFPCLVTGLGSQQESRGNPDRRPKQKAKNQQTRVVVLIHLTHPPFLISGT